jgi:glycosyltransferase 2 family protein
VKNKLRRYLTVLAKAAVTTVALWYVFTRIDVHQVLEAMRDSRPGFLAGALVLFVLSKLLSSFRLNRFLASIDILISQWSNWKLYLLGMFYNLFLPGGIGGDGYKIYYLTKRYEVTTRKIFWAVLLDRIIGVVVLFCMAVILFCFLPGTGRYAWFAWLLIPLSVFTAYIIIRRFFPYLLPVFSISQFYSRGIQLLQLGSALLILLSLKAPGQIESYLFVFLVSSIVAVLPLTIGGIGSREFTFMLGAQWLGLDLNLSISLSLIFYLITAFTSFWGIIYSVGPGPELKS